MAKRSSYFPVKIPLNTFSGGVGRQAPTKRLPSEVQDMDNMFCTTERSIDKRNGFEIVGDFGADLGIPALENKDLWWYWFLVGRKQQYLISIDYKAGANDDLLYVYKLEDDGSLSKQQVDPNISNDIRSYLTFGMGKAKDNLRACSVGSSVLVLNTVAKAGFTSDGTDNYMFDMNGEKTTTTDIKGRKIEYQSSIKVDPAGKAEVWTSFSDYIWGETAIYDGSIYKVKDSLDSTALPGPTNSSGEDAEGNNDPPVDADGVVNLLWEDTGNDTSYIPVEDYVYPNGETLYLGQSVSKWSDLKFPPDANDLPAWNGDSDTKETIRELYPNTGDSEGRGKVYYLSEAYLSSTAGWYRVINNDTTPYLEQLRTPDEMGVIDQNRMPMQIYLDVTNQNDDGEDDPQWSIRKIDWDHRTSGTTKSNPGPSFFKDSNGKAKQSSIKAISYYRDRLFLSSEDTLISSRIGNFDSFFLDDPTNITFRDPVDLKVSSNIYTPITFLQPFKDFLFLGTSGDTQYELMGSENQISPLTAEIAPTSFFPMTEDMAPLVMNNNLFFFAKNRLYIYFPIGEASGQQAFELSRHTPEYLPDNYWTSTVSTAHNMIFAVGGEEPSNTMFVYRNQTAGEQIVQNAFFTFTLNTDAKIHSIISIGDFLYAVIQQRNAVEKDIIQLHKLSLVPESGNISRIDNRTPASATNISYDPSTNKTTFDLDTSLKSLSQFICQGGDFSGSILDITIATSGSTDNFTRVEVDGNYLGLGSGIAGTKYTALVTLSDIFIRDDENNIIPGTLNLRYGIARHHITGSYDISVQRKGRTAKVYSFVHETIDSTEALLGDNFYELDGVFKFPLMGFSDDLVITISSDYPNPMNLTNLELSGKFKRVHHFLTT